MLITQSILSWIYRGFYAVTLLFVLVFLARLDYDYLSFPLRLDYFLISLALLFLGFFVQACSWVPGLYKDYLSVKNVLFWGFLAHSQTIFAKYLPGKIWALVGRAELYSRLSKESLYETSKVSLMCLFLSMVSGLLVGLTLSYNLIVGYFEDKFGGSGYSHYLLFLLVLLLFVVFNKLFLRPMRAVLLIVFCYIVNWLIWGAAFTFLASSYLGFLDVNFFASFIVATALSMAVVFSPGGLGVREGVLALLLSGQGYEESFIVAIVVISRLWFMLGELFIFIFGFICRKYN